MNQKLFDELNNFYTPGQVFKTKTLMTFWDKRMYEINHGATAVVPRFSYEIGTLITFLDFFLLGQFIHTVFLIDDKILIGPGGLCQSLKLIEERIDPITY